MKPTYQKQQQQSTINQHTNIQFKYKQMKLSFIPFVFPLFKKSHCFYHTVSSKHTTSLPSTYYKIMNGNGRDIQGKEVYEHGINKGNQKYFTNRLYLPHFLRDGDYICQVTVPSNIKIYSSSMEPGLFTASSFSLDFHNRQLKDEFAWNLEDIKKNPFIIRYISDPNHTFCMTAVENDGNAIAFIREPSEKVCIAAVKQNGLALAYIEKHHQTERVCIEAIHQTVFSSHFVLNVTPNLMRIIQRCHRNYFKT